MSSTFRLTRWARPIMHCIPNPSGPERGAQYNNYILAGANAPNQNEYGGKGDVQSQLQESPLDGFYTQPKTSHQLRPHPFAGVR